MYDGVIRGRWVPVSQVGRLGEQSSAYIFAEDRRPLTNLAYVVVRLRSPSSRGRVLTTCSAWPWLGRLVGPSARLSTCCSYTIVQERMTAGIVGLSAHADGGWAARKCRRLVLTAFA
jgi:hypothetical protein